MEIRLGMCLLLEKFTKVGVWQHLMQNMVEGKKLAFLLTGLRNRTSCELGTVLAKLANFYSGVYNMVLP